MLTVRSVNVHLGLNKEKKKKNQFLILIRKSVIGNFQYEISIDGFIEEVKLLSPTLNVKLMSTADNKLVIF